MIPSRHFTTALTLALALGLVAPIARGGQLEVNFNDLSYPNVGNPQGRSYDPGEGYPAGPAPGTGSYNDGWNLNGGFTSNGVFFSNSYDPTWNSWSGWAYSNVDDLPAANIPSGLVPDDYNHQFAAVTGSAPGGSGNYAIESGIGTGPAGVINLPAGTSPVSFEVTNTTYTYLAITHGDYGGATAFTNGSYFELKIYGYTGLDGTGTKVGEVDFYLADYTSTSSLPVDVWTLVNLSSLAGARSLNFDYASSDNNSIGPLTPENFAMDDLILSTAVPEPSSAVLALTGLTVAGLFAANRHRRSS